MTSPALRPNENMPLDTPGFGVAGQVMCPYGFQKSPCMKNGCELWVVLTYGEHKVGRCAHSWQAILNVELRQEITNLRNELNGSGIAKKGSTPTD